MRLHPTEKAASTRAQIRQEWSTLLDRALGSHEGVDGATDLLERLATQLVADRRREGLRAGSRNL